MERLTKLSEITGLSMPRAMMGSSDEDSCGEVCSLLEEDGKSCEDCPVQKCMTKLADYEKIGLEPEEIIKVIKSGVPEWIDKYIEYRKLENEGRLIRLPFNVGDDVYVLRHDIEAIEEGEIYCFTKHRFALMMRISMGHSRMAEINVNEIGRTVFISKQEAEKALEG